MAKSQLLSPFIFFISSLIKQKKQKYCYLCFVFLYFLSSKCIIQVGELQKKCMRLFMVEQHLQRLQGKDHKNEGGIAQFE